MDRSKLHGKTVCKLSFILFFHVVWIFPHYFFNWYSKILSTETDLNGRIEIPTICLK